MSLQLEKEGAAAEVSITDGVPIVSYVANDEGCQELVSGVVWQPVNVVNRQAWREIEKQVERSKAKVASGRVSCLHYYMTANQMDTGLLARYTGRPRWLVCLHLVPFVFKRLRVATVQTYAALFRVSPDELRAGRFAQPVYSQSTFQNEPDA